MAIFQTVMAIPKRQRRRIIVDGTAFHWTRGHNPEGGWVTIQLAAGRGRLLRLDLADIPLPADIADAIRFAITNGWNPVDAGAPMYLGFATDRARPRFVIRSASSGAYAMEVAARGPS